MGKGVARLLFSQHAPGSPLYGCYLLDIYYNRDWLLGHTAYTDIKFVNYS